MQCKYAKLRSRHKMQAAAGFTLYIDLRILGLESFFHVRKGHGQTSGMKNDQFARGFGKNSLTSTQPKHCDKKKQFQ
jgi:hypothetical protein